MHCDGLRIQLCYIPLGGYRERRLRKTKKVTSEMMLPYKKNNSKENNSSALWSFKANS